MAVFQYEGRDKTGKKKAGKVTAENRNEALVKLREIGVAVIRIEELKGLLYKEISIGGKKKVKNRDFTIYLRQFATLLKAGISVVEANKILEMQTTNKVLKKALADLIQNLEAGQPYTTGAEKHPNVFPTLFINMMRAGEAGGNMDEVLERMAVYFEKQYIASRKIKSALAYPASIGGITIIIIIFLLSTVVPSFANMFASFGGELPLITRIVMKLGDITRQIWWVFLLLALGMYFGLAYIRSNRKTKYYLDYALLKLPVIGNLLVKSQMALMTRTLSSLFSSSVPVLQSLTIVERVLGNEVITKVVKKAEDSIQQGQSITVPMEKHWAFPPMVTQMIVIGEKSGALDSMLEKIADFYEMEVDTASEQIKSLMEPLLIVFLAVGVGGIVSAIAVPMFSIFKTIQ